MIVEYTRYTLTGHTPSALLAAYDEAAKHLAASPDCFDYELTQCSDEPSNFVLRIRWSSAESHLKGFRAGPHFPPFLAAIRDFIPEIVEMRHYDLTTIVGTGVSQRNA